MEHFLNRRLAFEHMLTKAFQSTAGKTVCGSLLVAPWYHEFIRKLDTSTISDLHLYETHIQPALTQMHNQMPCASLFSRGAYERVWKETEEKTSFPIHTHFANPEDWDRGKSGCISNFWKQVTPSQMAKGEVLLILDTCQVETLETFQSALRRTFPKGLQEGAVILTNVGISRRGMYAAEGTEARLIRSLTKQKVRFKETITYCSKRDNGYSGHRRMLSVFKVD